MSTISSSFVLFFLLLMVAPPAPSFAALVKQQPLILKYHKGPLLTGHLLVHIVWYGNFSPVQRSIIVDFLNSLSAAKTVSPSVALWWNTTAKYHDSATVVSVRGQTLHSKYTLGKHLNSRHLLALASRPQPVANSVTLVLTSSDVAVEGFCMDSCGRHAFMGAGKRRSVWAWVGNSESQCPGLCAWPFARPQYGPQTQPLVAPNADMGVDGMIINVATVLAGAVTNPYGSGYFEGMYEAVSACVGTFGKNAYPGYPGEVAVDKTKGGSYNAQGINGRKFLLPAMWDPKTNDCSILT